MIFDDPGFRVESPIVALPLESIALEDVRWRYIVTALLVPNRKPESGAFHFPVPALQSGESHRLDGNRDLCSCEAIEAFRIALPTLREMTDVRRE